MQSSNIYLGKSFLGTNFPGEKLRASIKAAFTKMIDLASEQSVDMVILAGDVFANVDVSQNLIDFFISEIKRIETVPVIIIPGASDGYSRESFWVQWQIFPPTKNLHVLAAEDSTVNLEEKSAMIHGYAPFGDGRALHWPGNLDRDDKNKYHIAVVYGNVTTGSSSEGTEYPINYEKLAKAPFDYLALGGRNGSARLIDSGVRAAYSGSPVMLHPDWSDSGQVLLVEVDGKSITANPIQVSDLSWKEIEIPMESITNIDDLKGRIMELAGENVLLKVTLTGLALLEAGLNTGQLQKDFEGHFMNIEFIDKSSVLPDNVSGIKVQEKTVLGQYLKLMIGKLNEASGDEKKNLEESLKIGYTLLSGREMW